MIIPICWSDSRHHITIRPTKWMSLNMFIHCLNLINHHLSPMNVAGIPHFLTMLQKYLIQLVMCQRMSKSYSCLHTYIHIISYRTVAYRTVSYHIVSYHIISYQYHLVPNIILYHVYPISCHVPSDLYTPFFLLSSPLPFKGTLNTSATPQPRSSCPG